MAPSITGVADVSGLLVELENLGLDVFIDAQQILGDEAREAAPVDTGALRDSLELAVGGGGVVITGSIAFTADQAGFTNDGTQPHEITGDPLVFEIGGQTIFVTRVDHPGTQATHWFDNAVSDETWARAVQEALDSLSG